MRFPKLFFILFLLSIITNILFVYKFHTKIISFLGLNVTREKKEIEKIILDDETMVMLTFGQSNAANHSDELYNVRNQVYNFYRNKFYKGDDPLLGASNTGGSVWSRLGDQLIDSNKYKKVIVIPIAVSGSSITCWSEEDCHKDLINTLKDLNKNNIKLTHILYHQGETDNIQNTSKISYKEHLSKILKTIRSFTAAPLYISITSYHKNAYDHQLGLDTAIQNAQIEFIRENENVFFGSNTDTIIHAIDRYDGVHFSGFGLKKYANSWFGALEESREK